MTDLRELAERVAHGEGCDNALDVEIEVALFKPDAISRSARPNAAGTKVVYINHDGTQATHWAEEWTEDRPGAAAAILRALATTGEQSNHD